MSWGTEQDNPPDRPAPRAWVLAIAGIALAYVVFYWLNGWLFSTFKVTVTCPVFPSHSFL